MNGVPGSDTCNLLIMNIFLSDQFFVHSILVLGFSRVRVLNSFLLGKEGFWSPSQFLCVSGSDAYICCSDLSLFIRMQEIGCK